MLVEDEAKVASRVGGAERRVLDLSPMSRNSVLEEFRLRRFAVIQEEI